MAINIIMAKKFRIIKDAVTDACGNAYDAVEIGGHVWTASNLRTTKYSDGSDIGKDGAEDGKSAYFGYPLGLNCFSNEKLEKYGLLYNYRAVAGGLAPEGWHVPSLAEWERLFAFLADDPDCNLRPLLPDPWKSPIAKSLCASRDWNICQYPGTVGYRKKYNNASSFCAEPSGYYMFGKAFSMGEFAYFLTSDTTPDMADHSVGVVVGYSERHPMHSNYSTAIGMSVRCVKDE